MATLNFLADLKTKDGHVLAMLELFKFKEDSMTIVYCPSIDLSAYGRTDKEAESEFKDVFKLHMSHCLENSTLRKDLKAHGWQLSTKEKTKAIKAPSIEKMLPNNETLRDIIYNKDYTKVSKCIEIPEFA